MSELKKEDISIKEENKENFKESVIERENLTNEFTIADIEKHLETLGKMKTEADATLGVATAMKTNIEKNHNDVLEKLSMEERHHVAMWFEQENIINEISPQVKNVDEEIAIHQEYLDVIYDAFGYVKSGA